MLKDELKNKIFTELLTKASFVNASEFSFIIKCIEFNVMTLQDLCSEKFFIADVSEPFIILDVQLPSDAKLRLYSIVQVKAQKYTLNDFDHALSISRFVLEAAQLAYLVTY
jgi:hypothetical protein